MTTVFIPNKSFHDFDEAREYGELEFLTSGRINLMGSLNDIYRQCYEKMKDCQPGDYILVSSLSTINSIAASIMAYKHGRVNFLLFDARKGKYVERKVVLSDVIEQGEGK